MEDPTKPYELTFDARPNYLYVHIKADTTTRTIALAYLLEVAEECARLKYRRLMIERDVPVMMSDPDIFFTTNDFLDMIKFVRVAFVNPYTTQEGAMKFAMLVGTNRGAKFKAYQTVEEAEKWLLEGIRTYAREEER